ncbi:glycosyltransferase family 2 protein [Flavobacterium branchiarum]|uniref:Glycosyltransferase family 2 protein n=1 Tax=Flavobacterium branchiarum TaxID=1114870 RepID=A0ABV5FI79_9FLAO|nr:glycosyltransferase family 2 protein [Flavobacterium branchiarum]MDN3674144.1 glycosyltransferase family 2 protein [Flavobacterium branchiarum]
MAFFSIVVPLYNASNHIENTLKSIFKQTFTDYEIIIINDGSIDDSETKVIDLKDSRISVYSQKNQGVSVARNLGIEKSKGKLIAFLDADDYWYPNHLETLFELYNDISNCGIYCSRYKIKTVSKQFLLPNHNGVEDSFSGIIKDYFYSNAPFRTTWTSSLAISKEILLKFGGFTPGVTNGQDLELWTKIGIYQSVAISNKITAIYNYDTPKSLSKKNINTMKLMDFEQFKIAESQNSSLKKFLDLYRIEYGLRYYIFGDTEKMNFYLKDVDQQNINLKIRFLLNLPPFSLRILFKAKNHLKKINLYFSIYQ